MKEERRNDKEIATSSYASRPHIAGVPNIVSTLEVNCEVGFFVTKSPSRLQTTIVTGKLKGQIGGKPKTARSWIEFVARRKAQRYTRPLSLLSMLASSAVLLEPPSTKSLMRIRLALAGGGVALAPSPRAGGADPFTPLA